MSSWCATRLIVVCGHYALTVKLTGALPSKPFDKHKASCLQIHFTLFLNAAMPSNLFLKALCLQSSVTGCVNRNAWIILLRRSQRFEYQEWHQCQFYQEFFRHILLPSRAFCHNFKPFLTPVKSQNCLSCFLWDDKWQRIWSGLIVTLTVKLILILGMCMQELWLTFNSIVCRCCGHFMIL